ncbi:MAG: DUF1552 domain-containing protein [Myxococcota bacterium]
MTLTRRIVLRGAGSIAIGLPLLEEMMPKARADEGDGVPCRLFTMSFGLGIEQAMQLEQFSGPLQPFEPFADRMAFFTNVDASPLAGSGTPHFSTGAATFTGVPQQGGPEYHAGGPSMEQVMKRGLHPMGVPNVTVPEISVGIWSRTGAVSQFTRQWNEDGSPGPRPERRPSNVFNTIFGTYMPPDPGDAADPQLLAERHVHRSVLDTVLSQYESLTSPASPLGAASKARIDNHLSSIRDVELQLAPIEGGMGPLLECDPPGAGEIVDPQPYSFYDNDTGPTGAGAPEIDWQVADDAMRIIGELMAMGAACDAIRFGSLVCVGAGGHIRFSGQYDALGDSINFSNLFGGGTPHDLIFHAYNAANIRLYQHFAIRQLAHMLAAMDTHMEPNGQTVLDNSVVLVGTEYGENHNATNVFHGVVGGGGRFNPGWYDQAIIPSDIYDQVLDAYDVDSEIATRWPDYDPTEISGFR